MTDTIERDVHAPSDAGARQTNRQNAEKGFDASAKLTRNLQLVLVDLIELHLQGKQAHWNVVGKNFRDLHLQLDEIVEAARVFSDEVAERLRALHAIVDGRSDTVAATTSLPEFPNGEILTSDCIDLITSRLDTTVARIRKVHDYGGRRGSDIVGSPAPDHRETGAVLLDGRARRTGFPPRPPRASRQRVRSRAARLRRRPCTVPTRGTSSART